MKRSSTIALAAGALLAGIGLWWLSRVGGVEPKDAGPPPAPEAGPRDPSPPEDLDGGRKGLAVDRTSSATPPKPPDEGDPEPSGTIEGSVVDSRNRGVGGVQVAAVLGVARDAEAYDADARANERTVARARTDADGKFALEVALGRGHELRATAPGYAVGIASAVHAGERPTILLRHGAILSGTARRKEGGTPVAGARMFLVPAGGRSVAPLWEGRTDEKGSYLAENLPPGSHLLYALPEKLALAVDRVTLAEGETRTHDISVSTGAVVLGEVRDGESGLPIAGAEVSPYEFRMLTVRTDEAGRYELAGLDAGAARLTVWARAPGYGVYEAGAGALEGGVVRADFELVKSRSARGRVVSREGAPIADARVLASASRRDGAIVRTDRRAASSGSDGGFEISDLRTDLPHAIVVRKDRFAEAVLETIPAGVAGEIDLGDVVLGPSASLEGTVTTPGGDPIQAAGVNLVPVPCADLERCPLERFVWTDAKGVFRFADLSAGTFRIDVLAEGIPDRKEGWTATLAEEESKRGFRIVVGEGRSISGRVVDARGLGVEDAEVELFVAAAGDLVPAASLRARTRSDGTFQANGLEAAEYDVAARFPKEYGPADDRHRLIDARVERVAAGTTELVLELRRGGELSGRVAGLEEALELRPYLLAVDLEGRRVAGAHLAAHGRFALQVPAGELVELRVWTDAPESIARGPATSDPEHPPQAVHPGARAGDPGVVLYVKP